MAQSRNYVSSKRAAQSQETTQRILAAARELFARQGYGGTSIDEVARKAGVSVQTIYQRFGDKAALLKGQLNDIDRAADLRTLRATVDDSKAPAREQVKALAHFVGQIAEVVAALIVAARTLNDPQLKALEQGGMSRHLHGTAGLAAQWKRRGLLRDGLSAKRAGMSLAATCSIAMFSELQEVHGLSHTEAEAWIVEAVLRLLLKGEGAD